MMLSGDYNSIVYSAILDTMGKRLGDCISQADQYCVEMAQSIKGMVIRRNSTLSNQAIPALALEEYIVSKSHMDIDICDLARRLTERQETKNSNTDEILGKLYIEFVAISKEREIENKMGRMGRRHKKIATPHTSGSTEEVFEMANKGNQRR